jgi:hypothetical protein
VSSARSPTSAFKKKLYTLNPQNPPPPLLTQRAGNRVRLEPADAQGVERQVRQLLADKLSGSLLGLWLLQRLRQPERGRASREPFGVR